MSDSFKERRQYVRIYRNFIMSYGLVSNPKDRFDISQINNISKGGVRFVSTHPIALGEILDIQLKVPFFTDTLNMRGKVLDCSDKISGLIFDVRVQFSDVSAEVLNLMDKIERYSPGEME